MMNLIYEGKAKKIYESNDSNEVIVWFKDDTTAFNGEKKDIINEKGRVNLLFTRYFFRLLESEGIKTHLLDFIDEKSFKAQKVNIIPVEVVIRNYAAGSICKRLGFEKGERFNLPLCEFYLKDDNLKDPLIYKSQIKYKYEITDEELDIIESAALRINSIMSFYLCEKNITLVDFKLEFGKNKNGEIILADEISPDTCRFWKKGTTESLDKDVYREEKGDLLSSYKELAQILGVYDEV
ncbi:MAG: phosphoribosylaminoimidazolesuccinocarboxamide synthase [bacterium]